METVPSEDRAEGETLPILGHEWNRQNDSLGVKPVKFISDGKVTKRTILKEVASVYDPLGLFSPVTLRGKLLLQQLWTKHLDWDETVDDKDVSVWNSVKKELRRYSKSHS